MLAGQTADAFCASLAARRPAFHRAQLRHRAGVHDRPPAHHQRDGPTRVSCYPNAGLPDEDGKYLETPATHGGAARALHRERLAEHRGRLLRHHRRAHPRHRADGGGQAAAAHPGALAPRVLFGHRTGGGRREQPPADRGRAHQRHRLAAVQEPGGGGEVGGGHRDRAAAGAQRRAHRGCLPAKRRPRRDGGHPAVLREADPQDQSAADDRHHRPASAVELALTYCQGKSIINSINLEDGEEKFERVCPLARRYGAALVVGSIDEDKLQAQAFTRERKLAVARALLQAAHRKVRHPARGHHHRPAGVSRAPPATPTTSARRWRPSKASGW